VIYGLYLSAAGVQTNAYRQDVIANNLANSETVGFKRDLALFQARRTEAQELGAPGLSNAMLERLGGGIFAYPTQVDTAQGELEPTGNNLDVAIEGKGFFTVNDGGQTRLTRDGRFIVNRQGHLSLATSEAQEVLDVKGKPITLDSRYVGGKTTIGRFGEVTQDGKAVARLAVVDVDDYSKLQKRGGTLLTYADEGNFKPANGVLRSEFIERGNVEPATELSLLMDAQRQLEANANMIRYQDATLQRLVNDVGKIS
jgi:flagellar basal body rod protein FlgG